MKSWLVSLTYSPGHAAAELWDDASPAHRLPGIVEYPGRLSFHVNSPPWAAGTGAHLRVTADGYQPAERNFALPGDNGEVPGGPVDLQPVPQTAPPRLHVAGRHFATPGGIRVDLIGADSYSAVLRLRDGEEGLLREQLDELRALGFNAIRVFSTMKNIPEQVGRPMLTPRPDLLHPLFDIAAEHGLYALLVAFTDTGDTCPHEADQHSYWTPVVTSAQMHDNALLSLVNEYDAHENYVDRWKFMRPLGVAASSGSGGSDAVPTPPHWDFIEFHPRRDYPGHTKDCCVVDHPLYLNEGRAVLLDEPDRYGEEGNTNTEQAALSAGASVESAMGFFYHTRDGVFSRPFRPNALAGAREVIRVLQKRRGE